MIKIKKAIHVISSQGLLVFVLRLLSYFNHLFFLEPKRKVITTIDDTSVEQSAASKRNLCLFSQDALQNIKFITI